MSVSLPVGSRTDDDYTTAAEAAIANLVRFRTSEGVAQLYRRSASDRNASSESARSLSSHHTDCSRDGGPDPGRRSESPPRASRLAPAFQVGAMTAPLARRSTVTAEGKRARAGLGVEPVKQSGNRCGHFCADRHSAIRRQVVAVYAFTQLPVRRSRRGCLSLGCGEGFALRVSNGHVHTAFIPIWIRFASSRLAHSCCSASCCRSICDATPAQRVPQTARRDPPFLLPARWCRRPFDRRASAPAPTAKSER